MRPPRPSRSSAPSRPPWPWTRRGPNAEFTSLWDSFLAYDHVDRQMKAGEVVRVDGAQYFVREDSGNVVQMHVDGTTEKRSSAMVKPGEHVIAKVDALGHAISFLADQPIAH